MFDACSGKKHVSRAEYLASVVAYIFTTAGCDEIEFIPRVWLLRISATRCINLNQKGAVFEKVCETLAFRTREMGKRICNCELLARLFFVHAEPFIRQKRPRSQ